MSRVFRSGQEVYVAAVKGKIRSQQDQQLRLLAAASEVAKGGQRPADPQLRRQYLLGLTLLRAMKRAEEREVAA